MTTALISNTPNDGPQNITIPAFIVSLQNACVLISCSDKIFFAVSEGDINVLDACPVLWVNSPSIIEVPVAGDTMAEDNQILNLSLMKLLNAKFADQINALTTQGTIIDDDIALIVVSANLDTTTKNSISPSASGGGSFSLLSIFGLLLLSIRRKIILRLT